MTPVAVVGASGFSGMELCRLVAGAPELELVAAIADRWRGERLGDRVEAEGPAADLVVRPQAELEGAVDAAAIVALATPAEVSIELAPRLLARGKRVLDLSGGFRLEDPAAYARWYGLEHAAPSLLREARYALPELPRTAGPSAPGIGEARLGANPGCYATAAILATAPLLAEGALEPRVFIDGKSGVTGAGRKLAEPYLFTEIDANVSPYRVGVHQHCPEIELALGRACGRPVAVTFVPHLLPIARGLLTTVFGAAIGEPDVAAILGRAYAGSPIVRVVAPEQVSIARVARTARAAVGGRADPERRSLVAICAIDNLMKGAASQALQNLVAMAAPAAPMEA
jgi:N-acetyl-gamma-glutamyl-phosphate reductase